MVCITHGIALQNIRCTTVFVKSAMHCVAIFVLAVRLKDFADFISGAQYCALIRCCTPQANFFTYNVHITTNPVHSSSGLLEPVLISQRCLCDVFTDWRVQKLRFCVDILKECPFVVDTAFSPFCAREGSAAGRTGYLVQSTFSWSYLWALHQRGDEGSLASRSESKAGTRARQVMGGKQLYSYQMVRKCSNTILWITLARRARSMTTFSWLVYGHFNARVFFSPPITSPLLCVYSAGEVAGCKNGINFVYRKTCCPQNMLFFVFRIVSRN